MPPDIGEKIEKRELGFIVYADATDLASEKKVALLEKLGVWRVNVGFDSADPRSLSALKNRESTPENNEKALANLIFKGITIHASFVAGAKGETAQRLESTIQYIREIVERYHTDDRPIFSSIELSPLVPMPNSRAWADVLNAKPEYRDNDLVDIDAVIETWFSKYTKLDYTDVIEKISDVDKFLESHNIMTGKAS